WRLQLSAKRRLLQKVRSATHHEPISPSSSLGCWISAGAGPGLRRQENRRAAIACTAIDAAGSNAGNHAPAHAKSNLGAAIAIAQPGHAAARARAKPVGDG